MRTQLIKEYKVVAKSLNTNSFGLFQMVVLAKDGEAYKVHASMYNVKNEGETVNQMLNLINGKLVGSIFEGCEVPEKIENKAPQHIIDKYWN